MKIRKTTTQDINQVMHLIQQAQAYFKSQGIDQWQDGYPNHEKIYEDIQHDISYVLEDEGEIIATAAISLADDPTYEVIDGAWISDNPYAVIHRICVDNERKGKNIALQLLQYTQDLALNKGFRSIRIDTHQDNQSMQRFLLKHGFVYCGIITLESKALRLAYEKILMVSK